MIKQYETVFIFTPVLSDSEVKKATQEYQSFLKDGGGSIVAEDLWGMRQLAYPIAKKTTGIYYVLEHMVDGTIIDKLEIKAKRDPNVLRFLTVKLDKHAIKYNDMKRKGEISQFKHKNKASEEADKTEDNG